MSTTTTTSRELDPRAEFDASVEAAASRILATLPETLYVSDFQSYMRAKANPQAFTFTDIFCGAGGSSIGLALGGGRLVFAANHSQVAIDTHSTNFVDADHKCADVNNYDMRKLPVTDVLWASPICTEISPAGGKKKVKVQMDLFAEPTEVEKEAFVRTRATFHDVIRATEVRRYKAVVVENVVEVASKWELFDWWVDGMKQLGYNVQFLSVNSAHVGGFEAAPQWRDRLYMVFTRKGIRLPDVASRPLAWCPECDEDVYAVQSWRKDDGRGRNVGCYGQQYDYVCPNAPRHPGKPGLVEPYVRPAGAAIDWSKLGTPLGERKRPLKQTTMDKIEAAMAMLSTEPMMVTLTHGKDSDGRSFPVGAAPLPTRTVKIGDGMAVPPGALVPSGGTWRTDPTGLSVPMPARTTRDNDALVLPPGVVTLRKNSRPHTAEGGPLATMAASGNHHGLVAPPNAELTLPNSWDRMMVIPYRRGAKPHRVNAPLSTIATHTQHGLAEVAVNLDEVRYRMLSWREQATAQAFPLSYEMKGNGEEKTMQAGNAVSSNVARFIAEALAKVL